MIVYVENGIQCPRCGTQRSYRLEFVTLVQAGSERPCETCGMTKVDPGPILEYRGCDRCVAKALFGKSFVFGPPRPRRQSALWRLLTGH